MNDYNKILKYIQKEIVPKYPEIKSCNIHILPKSLDKHIEFMFKLNNKNLSENQIWRLWADIDFDIHKIYENLNFEFNFITVLI